jgi:hypothetical protein
MVTKHTKHKKKKLKTKKGKINMFKKEHCSPKNSDNEVSCLDDKLLIKIGNLLNEYHDANIQINTERQQLHDNISEKISEMSKCGSEKCWMTIREIKKRLNPNELELFEHSFKPTMPQEWKKDKNTWLTTTDLWETIKRLMDKHKEFHSEPPLPVDFNKKRDNQCISGDLCNIDLNSHLKEGKNKIGIVFNMDEHDEPGSHWTALYTELEPCCRKNPSIYYFDSIGDKAPKEIMELVDKLQDQYKSIKGINMDFLYNDIQHQKGTTECGIYCLHFITSMLEGVEFEKYVNTKINDENMEEFRSIYFIP